MNLPDYRSQVVYSHATADKVETVSLRWAGETLPGDSVYSSTRKEWQAVMDAVAPLLDRFVAAHPGVSEHTLVISRRAK